MMVTVKRKAIGKETYYYLEHSIRKGGKIYKKEMYIGKALPKDIDHVKAGFLYQIYKGKWFNAFDEIKKNFSTDRRSLPKAAEEKRIENFSINYTYDSQRIEGSKLTLRETADLLEGGITPKGKPFRDVREAEAHQKVFYKMMGHEEDLSLQTVLLWHKRLFEATKPDIAGKLRQHQVLIAGSKFIPPLHVEVYPLLRQFFGWYEKNKRNLHPVELAATVHLKFVTIHPFSDGNGRLSRLMMNFVLKRYVFPMLNISYRDRRSYYNALERAQIKGQDSVFLQWFYRRYMKEQKTYLRSSKR